MSQVLIVRLIAIKFKRSFRFSFGIRFPILCHKIPAKKLYLANSNLDLAYANVILL